MRWVAPRTECQRQTPTTPTGQTMGHRDRQVHKGMGVGAGCPDNFPIHTPAPHTRKEEAGRTRSADRGRGSGSAPRRRGLIMLHKTPLVHGSNSASKNGM